MRHTYREREPHPVGTLFDEYGDGVFTLAARMLGSVHAAEDVVQETFLTALHKLHTYRGDGPVAGWLYRIAYRQAVTVMRRQRDQPMAPSDITESASSITVEAEVLNKELALKLDEAIAGLEPLLRAAFLLRDVEGLSTKETAGALDVSESAIKMRLTRARKQLRVELGGYL